MMRLDVEIFNRKVGMGNVTFDNNTAKNPAFENST